MYTFSNKLDSIPPTPLHKPETTRWVCQPRHENIRRSYKTSESFSNLLSARAIVESRATRMIMRRHWNNQHALSRGFVYTEEKDYNDRKANQPESILIAMLQVWAYHISVHHSSYSSLWSIPSGHLALTSTKISVLDSTVIHTVEAILWQDTTNTMTRAWFPPRESESTLCSRRSRTNDAVVVVLGSFVQGYEVSVQELLLAAGALKLVLNPATLNYWINKQWRWTLRWSMLPS